MGWTLKKNGITPKLTLTITEQDHLNVFMGLIQNKGLSPKEACEGWDSNYKKLKGSSNLYEIRLSQGNRAFFLVDSKNEIVTMTQVGGHT